MAINVYWGSNNSGTQISQPLNHGNVTNGNTTSEQTVWIWHNGVNSITNCAFYLAQYSGAYSGGSSAANDYNELLAWGDGADDDAFGGYAINMNATGSFANWATRGTNPYSDYSLVFNTSANHGADADNAFPTAAEMKGGGGGTDGVIEANAPNGYGLDYRFKCRVQVPTDEDTAGKRQFDLTLRYTYTS
jgi:hypothetical protein